MEHSTATAIDNNESPSQQRRSLNSSSGNDTAHIALHRMMEIDEATTSTVTHDFSLNEEHHQHQQQQQQQQQQHPSSSAAAANIGRRPLFYSWIPKFIRYDDPHIPIEATGCAVDMVARAVVFMATIFLGPGLLELASNHATENCTDEQRTEDECRVYGFKPSSLLSNIAMVAGFVSTVLLPICGAIVDHTSHRRAVGAWSAGGLALVKLVESIILGPSTWFLVACFQVVSGVLYQLHVAAVYAYSAELTQTPTLQSGHQTHFFFCMYVGMLCYMVQVLVVGHWRDTDDVGTARLGLVVTTIWSTPLFAVAWKFLFRERPPVAYLDAGQHQSLWTVGFSNLYHTTRTLHERPATGIFLAGIMFSEASDAALPTIATTYMSEFLGMEALEIGVTILINLIAGIPGTWLGHAICQRYSPVVSAKMAVLLYMVTTAIASVVLKQTTPKPWVYLFGALWGVCQGWMHPQHTTIFVTIAPQTMEWMGVFLFATQVLVFLPPLVFTVLNEMGIPMNWGLASLVAYFGLGFLGLVGMGDYQQAMNHQKWGEGGQPVATTAADAATQRAQPSAFEDEDPNTTPN